MHIGINLKCGGTPFSMLPCPWAYVHLGKPHHIHARTPSKAAPWSKTGGLGDVIGSLPIALAERGHRVMVVIPRYDDYEDTLDTGVSDRELLIGGCVEPGDAGARRAAAAEVAAAGPISRRKEVRRPRPTPAAFLYIGHAQRRSGGP
jgi:hypothetical protein